MVRHMSVSSTVVLSRAFLHEHFLFFTYLSYHTTRTLSTSRTSPSSLGRQIAPSRITLAWRPAECSVQFLLSCASFFSSRSVYTSSQCLWSSSCHSALSSVKYPFTWNFCQRLSFRLFLPWFQAASHVTLCSGITGLFLEYSPLDLCGALCCNFLT